MSYANENTILAWERYKKVAGLNHLKDPNLIFGSPTAVYLYTCLVRSLVLSKDYEISIVVSLLSTQH
jgi:hypothetical protein